MKEQGLIIPFGCEQPLGIASDLVMKREGLSATSEFKIRERIPFDMLLVGLFGLVLDNAGNPTLAYSLSFKNSRSGESFIYTAGEDGREAVVPACLVVGTSTETFYWPAPIVVRKTDTFEIRIIPDTGVTISYASFSFEARRLRGYEAEEILCLDPLISGYQCMVFEEFEVTESGTIGQAGREVRKSLEIAAARFDFLMSMMGVYNFATVAPGNQDSVPLLTTITSARTSYNQAGGRHDHQFAGVPSNRFGGVGAAGSLVAESWRPVASPLPACMRFYQQSSLEAHVSMIAPRGNTTVRTRVILHGQRIPTEGLPPNFGYPQVSSPPGADDPYRRAPA